jgi:Cdc6-like AAA superfamily ATPase
MTSSANEQNPTAMSLLKTEINRFLQSEKAEVLCIRGKWGVGKTYTWEMFLREAHTAKPLQQKYSYVSLFGLDTLDKFKTTIFENTVPIDSIGSEPSLSGLNRKMCLRPP